MKGGLSQMRNLRENKEIKKCKTSGLVNRNTGILTTEKLLCSFFAWIALSSFWEKKFYWVTGNIGLCFHACFVRQLRCG